MSTAGSSWRWSAMAGSLGEPAPPAAACPTTRSQLPDGRGAWHGPGSGTCGRPTRRGSGLGVGAEQHRVQDGGGQDAHEDAAEPGTPVDADDPEDHVEEDQDPD